MRSHFENLPSPEIERRLADMARADTSLRCTTSHYDPILTPIITSFFSVGFAASAVGQAVIGGIGLLATTSISLGIQYRSRP